MTGSAPYHVPPDRRLVVAQDGAEARLKNKVMDVLVELAGPSANPGLLR